MKWRNGAIARFSILLCAAGIPALAHAQRHTAPKDVLLEAMRDEMTRSIEKLRLEDLERPYHIEYAVEDWESHEIEASFGAVVRSDRNRRRRLRVDVRVGSYDLDNSEFVPRSMMSFFSASRPKVLALEDDYAAIRHDLWLATDAAYKDALELLAKKRATIENQVETGEIADYSREEPVQAIEASPRVEFDAAGWNESVRRISAVFREFPSIYESRVRLRVRIATKYLVNSEGTVCRQPATLVSLHATAATQAPDGMQLKHYVPFYATRPENLPPEGEIEAAVRRMAAQLDALTSAPILEKYVGPVLIGGPAAADLFAQLLAPHLSGHRPPLTEMPHLARMLPQSKLAGRLGRRVLPAFLTVVDDPTQTSHRGETLIGAYRVDDQGVQAREVTLIQDGVLETLLMSRRPREEIGNSNGHGRATFLGDPSAEIGNLFVRTSEGQGLSQLKELLIEQCRDEGLPYGLMIRQLDNPRITGRDASDSPFAMMSREMGGESLTPPILAYKVSVEDGQEELVRGLEVASVSLRTLKDIVAAGNDAHVNHLLLGGAEGLSQFSLFGSIMGNAPGVPASVIAPSVLVEELELKRRSGPQRKPALLEHPFFAN